MHLRAGPRHRLSRAAGIDCGTVRGEPAWRGRGKKRLYRTGDLARIDDQGQAHWLGRADGQVKVRGFRVELGEIEAALTAQPGLAAVAALVRPFGDGEQVVAFVLPAAAPPGLPQRRDEAGRTARTPLPDGEVTPAALRLALASRLPAYMVPAHFEVVSQLPRLASGKVDRKALRTAPLRITESEHRDSAAPRNQDETALYAALGKVFPGRALCAEADFFDDLGGHSLLAAPGPATCLRPPRRTSPIAPGRTPPASTPRRAECYRPRPP